MVPEEITPLVPAVVGEKIADDQTCYILDTLLKYMVIQVITNYVMYVCCTSMYYFSYTVYICYPRLV